MNVLKTLSASILMTVSSIASSVNPTWHASTIKHVYPLASGAFVLTFNEDSGSCTSSNSPRKYYRVEVNQNGMTDSGANKVYSAALAAASVGNKVYIRFDADSSQCYIDALQVEY